MASGNSFSRRGFLQASAVSAEIARARTSLASSGQGQRLAANSIASNVVSYRDPAPGAVEQPLGRLQDFDSFINAFRFFTSAEIADAASYRGTLDLTAPLQRALDAAWSTNRDLFLPAGLYRVSGLVLPGGAAERSRAFRFYGQGSGELFARGEDGGTIIKGVQGASVLHSRMASFRSGNGNQEVAYIRFEGDSSKPVLDFETLYAQSELHHCGVYQSGSGDGVRIRYANTIDVHHNYVLNGDWLEAHSGRRTGAGIRLTAASDNGLMTLRKNTTRGFDWGIWLGARGSGVLYSARIEQCEASSCSNGIRLDETVRAGVVENCYLEGGDGGVGILNLGNGNTISNNLIFPGFSTGIEDGQTAAATRILGNTISAGNARTVNSRGCTLIRTHGAGPVKLVQGNYLIADPVSFGPVQRVVGLAIDGPAGSVVALANAFDPTGSWGTGRDTAKVTGESQTADGSPCIAPSDALGIGAVLGLPFLALPHLVRTEGGHGGDELVLPRGTWFDVSHLEPMLIAGVESPNPQGGPVVLLDRTGVLRVEESERVRLAAGKPFSGPGTLNLLLVPDPDGTKAFEITRSNF